jgi:DNA-binding transcriptional regulator/RsmH inhibitor MraZ
MTRMDMNGNTTSKSRKGLTLLVKQADVYTTDSAGRIMVEDSRGGMIVFFAQDEPSLTRWVVNNLEKRA